MVHYVHECPNRYWVCCLSLRSYDRGAGLYRKPSASCMADMPWTWGDTTAQSYLPSFEVERTRRIQSGDHERYQDSLVAGHKVRSMISSHRNTQLTNTDSTGSAWPSFRSSGSSTTSPPTPSASTPPPGSPSFLEIPPLSGNPSAGPLSSMSSTYQVQSAVPSSATILALVSRSLSESSSKA